MNKITSTLAGLAVVATASIAPAFAQGQLFSPAGGSAFTFTTTANTISFVNQTAQFNPSAGGATTTAVFNLTGTRTSGNIFSVTSLSFTPSGGSLFTETSPLSFVDVTLPSGSTFLGSLGSAPDGTSFSLTSAPVPEASTVVSFGALLALGGLALVARRKGVKNVA